MTKQIVRTALAVLFSLASLSPVYGQAEGEKKQEKTGHCEKLQADGKTVDLEAKDKADCKAKGGKWNKAAKDDHDHG